MKCISILRYLTDHLENLPLGVTARVMITQDIPIVLANLLDMKPWLKVSGENNTRVFEGSDWVLEDETASALPKIEGIVYIS